MSWHQVTYLTWRCDGEVPHGQCGELLYPDEDCEFAQFAWDRVGSAVRLPLLMTEKASSQLELDPEWVRHHGWLNAGDRLLCPQHVAALERMAEAELAGLPFEG